MYEATIPAGDSAALVSLFGTRDQHLRQILNAIEVDIFTRDGEIHVEGEKDAVERATQVLEQLKLLIGRKGILAKEEVAAAIARAVTGEDPTDYAPIEIRNAGRQIRPRTEGQSAYIKAIREHDLVFCTGPAGTGKTYLAVAMAVEALKSKRVRKLVLVRPAVEAGESLGFLPGDLQAKINPYLRPLLDALREMMDFDQINRLKEVDVIEMIPLAYMRGRTLNEAFIILDEAQNTTIAQMKMFLTRMGYNSKIVVCGDTTQVDLAPHAKSGLIDAVGRLAGIEGFSHVSLGNRDIVRHKLVDRVVRAYEGGPQHRR